MKVNLTSPGMNCSTVSNITVEENPEPTSTMGRGRNLVHEPTLVEEVTAAEILLLGEGQLRIELRELIEKHKLLGVPHIDSDSTAPLGFVARIAA